MKRMAEMKDMYKLARYIDSGKYKPDRKEFKEPKTAIEDCAERYSKKKLGVSCAKAQSIIDNAMAHDYIKVIGDPPRGHTLRVVAPKGRQLVAKRWFFYRCGLAEQTMQNYPETKQAYRTIFTAVAGIIGAIAGSLVTVLAQVFFGE